MLRKTILLLPFFFVSALPSLAQSNIDSLENKLRESISDSLRIRTLVRLAYAYQYLDLKKSFEECEKAVHLAETKNLQWGKTHTYLALANFYGLSGDFSSSAKYNDQALDISFQLKDSANMASGYNNLGHNYNSFGKYDEAYFYYTQSYRLASTIKDSLGMAVALHNMASVFKELGQYTRALDYLRLTQEISDAIHDREGEAYNYDEIGDIYRRKGEYDSAIRALTHSLKASRSLRLKINDLEPATIIKIAKTYFAKKDNAHALAYYDTALFFFKKTDNEFGLAEVDLGRGIVYMKEKKYDQARTLMERSVAVAHQTKSWTLEIECYENLATLFQEQGDFKKSLRYYRQYKELEDSLF